MMDGTMREKLIELAAFSVINRTLSEFDMHVKPYASCFGEPLGERVYTDCWELRSCRRCVKEVFVQLYPDFPRCVMVCLCHRCDNRRCIRPDHLFLGTHVDNQRDAMLKGRKYRSRSNRLRRKKRVERRLTKLEKKLRRLGHLENAKTMLESAIRVQKQLLFDLDRVV